MPKTEIPIPDLLTSNTTEPTPDANLIEIGVVVAGDLDSVDRPAVRMAVDCFRNELETEFAGEGLRFRIEWSRRRELGGTNRVEPAALLREAQAERDAKGWDFALIVTAAELLSRYSVGSCFAVLSRPLDAAVFSTSLIDPDAVGEDGSPEVRSQAIARRLCQLMLHALGHLTGLSRSVEPDRLMSHPETAADLDGVERLDDGQRSRQLRALREIADVRLEERETGGGKPFQFFLRAGWINRLEIIEAVWAARPWQFPRRLSALTIAAVSTLFILMMTAEAWDLALAQDAWTVVSLALVVTLATTFYVALRQQLVIRRSRRATEQNVVTSVSAILIVLAGMTTTWMCLVGLGTIVSVVLFDSNLIAQWAASSELRPSRIGATAYVKMSGFGGSLGLLIGALGASFESQSHFQHVIFVDEEI